jgi:hypothetical protein
LKQITCEVDSHMGTRQPQPKKPIEIGLPWSLLFIPVMFIGAGLSIPYSLISRRIQRRREREFRTQMEAIGRVIEWSDFVQAISENRGTLIEERYSFKGPVRWWWTPEDLYSMCPYPTADWLTMTNDDGFGPFAEWCRQRYTSPDRGEAFFVNVRAVPTSEVRSVSSGVRSESGTARWIEVAPPKSLHKQ